ncbi:MAG: AAA family ATPase [Candidatus Dependentiae bacterium]|nr:AAA family ATPase [Candidatus Dependentiae bacterium]
MLFSNKIKAGAFALVFICTYTIPQTEANKKNPEPHVAKTQQTATYDAQTIDIIKKETVAALKQIQSTHILLNQLKVAITSGQVKSLSKKDKQKMYTYVEQLQDYIKQILKTPITPVNPFTPIAIYEINTEIINHISKGLSQGFDTTTFDINGAIARAKKIQPITLKIYAELQATNQQLYKDLEKQITNVGLSWYNHAYRAFDAVFVEPVLKHKLYEEIPTIIKGVAGGLYLSWRYNKNTFDNYMPTCISQNVFGAIPTPLNHNNLALVGKLDLLCQQHPMIPALFLMQGISPNGFLGNFQGNLSYEWDKWSAKFGPNIAKKLDAIRNRLKGGIYNNMADKLDGIIDPTTFDDLVGVDHVKDTFRGIVDYMQNPELAIKSGNIPEKGLLLVGPPGTGKTAATTALCNEINKINKNNGKPIKFWNVTSQEISRWSLKTIFDIAKHNAPYILFIDEVDLLNLQRGFSNPTLNEFLTGMSGLLDMQDPTKQVIIIAATNRPETLDFALLRPGRFGTQIRFELPTIDIRKLAIKKKLHKMGLSLDNAENAIHQIALETEGAPFEALNDLVKNAFAHSNKRQELFNETHLRLGLNSSYRKITPYINRHAPTDEQNILASHIAGQALTVHLLDATTKLADVTLHPYMPLLMEKSSINKHFAAQDPNKDEREPDRYEYGKVFTYKETDSIAMPSKDEQLKQCKIKVAGVVAEELILGSASNSCHPKDMAEAFDIAKALTFEGIKEAHLSKSECDRRSSEALAIVENCKKDVRALLTANKDKLTKLISALQEKKQLSRDEVLAVIK